jgi:hypothetical protein
MFAQVAAADWMDDVAVKMGQKLIRVGSKEDFPNADPANDPSVPVTMGNIDDCNKTTLAQEVVDKREADKASVASMITSQLNMSCLDNLKAINVSLTLGIPYIDPWSLLNGLIAKLCADVNKVIGAANGAMASAVAGSVTLGPFGQVTSGGVSTSNGAGRASGFSGSVSAFSSSAGTGMGVGNTNGVIGNNNANGSVKGSGTYVLPSLWPATPAKP